MSWVGVRGVEGEVVNCRAAVTVAVAASLGGRGGAAGTSESAQLLVLEVNESISMMRGTTRMRNAVPAIHAALPAGGDGMEKQMSDRGRWRAWARRRPRWGMQWKCRNAIPAAAAAIAHQCSLTISMQRMMRRGERPWRRRSWWATWQLQRENWL